MSADVDDRHDTSSAPTPVDLWTIRLDDESFPARDMDWVLDATEHTRASSFVFERDRRRFVRRRVALRVLLSRYCGVSPDRLEFGKGDNGKPYLAIPGDTSIIFSASHAHELALVAVSHGCDVGVDIEWSGRTVEWVAISGMFARDERARLRELSGSSLHLAGLRCWTRKEAFVKGRGDGLSLPLDLFTVSVDANEDARHVQVAPEIDDGFCWALTDIDVPPDYVASLATTFGVPPIRLYDATTLRSLRS